MTKKEISDTVDAVEANRAEAVEAERKARDPQRPSAERAEWAARADQLRAVVREFLDQLRRAGVQHE